MNLKETNQALALAQAFDRRTVGEMDVRAWHAVLGDLDSADVLEAIRRHYAVETDWIMPAHVRRLSVEIELERRKAAAKWAPGQYGVPKAEALPEIAEGEAPGWFAGAVQRAVSTSAAEIMAEIRRQLPAGSREALMPRTVAWEREQRAYLRVRDAEPNPFYRPKVPEVAEDFVECGADTPDGPCVLSASHPVAPMYPGFHGHMASVGE